MRIPSILGPGRSTAVRIGIAVLVGASTGTVVGSIARWRYAPAAGWTATAVVYLVWLWASVAKMSAGPPDAAARWYHSGIIASWE